MRKALILFLSIVACSAEPVEESAQVAQYTPGLQGAAIRAPGDLCPELGHVGCPCTHGFCFDGTCEGSSYSEDRLIEDFGVCVPLGDQDPQEGPVSDDRPDKLAAPTCPATPTDPQPDSCEQGDNVFYVSTSPEKCECSGMHWHCAEGWDSFSDECGCGCFLQE